MNRLEPVVRLGRNRLAIAYPGEKGVRIVEAQEDGMPKEVLALTTEQLQKMADAEYLPDGMSFDESLAIVLTWMSNR